jgi:hypothetical protein
MYEINFHNFILLKLQMVVLPVHKSSEMKQEKECRFYGHAENLFVKICELLVVPLEKSIYTGPGS